MPAGDDFKVSPNSPCNQDEERKVIDLDTRMETLRTVHVLPSSLKIKRLSVEQIDRQSDEDSSPAKSSEQKKSSFWFPRINSLRKGPQCGSFRKESTGSEKRVYVSLSDTRNEEEKEEMEVEEEEEEVERKVSLSSKLNTPRASLPIVRSPRMHLSKTSECGVNELPLQSSSKMGSSLNSNRNVSFRDWSARPAADRDVNPSTLIEVQVACLSGVGPGDAENLKSPDSDSCPVGVSRCKWLSSRTKIILPAAVAARRTIPASATLDSTEEAAEANRDSDTNGSCEDIFHPLPPSMDRDPLIHGPRKRSIKIRKSMTSEKNCNHDNTPALLTSRCVFAEQTRDFNHLYHFQSDL